MFFTTMAQPLLIVAALATVIALHAQPTTVPTTVQVIADQAEAILSILSRRASGTPIAEQDWQRLFTSDGYVRLKARELAMKRPLDEETFRKFVLTSAIVERTSLLQHTLDRWRRSDLSTAVAMARAYLPPAATIKAKVYPVIKPSTNSFVFDVRSDPAIFLYVDPAVSETKFLNTVAHELHHIGYGGSCPDLKTTTAISGQPERVQAVLNWIGAFGEGFAMLAAAGGPEVHPHATSGMEERAAWDRSIEQYSKDRQQIEAFFLDVLSGRLAGEAVQKTAFSFFGTQGPWYTVGWRMAVTIERRFGRERLVDAFCDPRKLLRVYNDALANAAPTPSTDRWTETPINQISQ